MLGPLDLIEQHTDVIVRSARHRPTQIAHLHSKRGQGSRLRALRQGAAKMIVDDRLERTSRAPRLCLQARSDVIFEGQGSTHILMLSA